jgi:mannose-6-phosphate isomerase-like protein (cupin superfamily)
VIIHPELAPEESQAGRALALKRVITREAHTLNLSLTWVRLFGHHERIVNGDCDRAYYVISGAARFQVGDGSPIEAVASGDVVFIAAGTPYEFEGEMTYLVINGPAFTPGSDRVLPSAFPLEQSGF